MNTLVKDLEWTTTIYTEDTLFTTHLDDGGRITVLDRLTGWGHGLRDVETGYLDQNDEFWLASGNLDIRNHPGYTIEQAIDWIQDHANTCVGVKTNRKKQ